MAGQRLWPCSAAGGLWLALWQQRWRWLGLLPCIAAIGLVLLSRPPDLLVDRTLGMAAVRHADGTVTMLEWHRDRLVQETWLRNLGTAAPLAAPRSRVPGTERGVDLRRGGLRRGLGGLRVTLAHEVEAAFEDCGRVDLVVARAGPELCRAWRRHAGPMGAAGLRRDRHHA